MRVLRMAWMYVAVIALTGGDCYQRAQGKSGNYEFSYDDPTVFAYEFPPLVAGGAHATIEANATGGGCSDKHPFTHVASSDPTIASFSYDGSRIEVTTGAAGTAELQLLNQNEAVVDRIDVIVEAVAELGPTTTSSKVFAGGTYELPVTMYGASGQELGAERGMLTTTWTGVDVTATEAFTHTDLQIAASQAGPAAIGLAAPGGVTDTFAIDVVTSDAITAIQLDPQYPPSFDGDHQRWTVYTIALVGSVPVVGATCQWQLSDSSVRIDWERPATNLASRETSEDSAFHLGSAGTFSATCTIGSAQLAVPLHR